MQKNLKPFFVLLLFMSLAGCVSVPLGCETAKFAVNWGIIEPVYYSKMKSNIPGVVEHLSQTPHHEATVTDDRDFRFEKKNGWTNIDVQSYKEIDIRKVDCSQLYR